MNKWLTVYKDRIPYLRNVFNFSDFKQAMSFMSMINFECEELDHHPRWINEYNTVTILLTTYDANNTITDKDRELASRIDTIYDKFFARR